MKPRAFNLIFSISVLLMMVLGSPSVNAYTFSQGGFPDGGLVTGSFSGVDRFGTGGYSHLFNIPPYGPDGIILSCSSRYCPFPELGEVQSFSIHFSGNPFFESLNNLPENGLNNLYYDINTNFLSFGFGTSGTVHNPYTPFWQYDSSGSIVFTDTSGSTIGLGTTDPLLVSQVPLPGALGLFLMGITGLGLVRRKLTS
ncbi:MAG: hypothetical protein HOO93_15445 [Methyloglobulus sp.]|nr:hypothetical protein [Methyloglobulus sp.]